MSAVISMIKNPNYFPSIIAESKHDDNVIKSQIQELTKELHDLGYKECEFNVKIKNKSVDDDGTLNIEGIASTTNMDLDDEIMNDYSQDSMVQQAVGKTVFFNHNYDYIIGKIVEAKKIIENGISKLWIKVAILDSWKDWLLEKLDFSIELGFSIGGFIKEWNYDDNWTRIIYDILLLEVSLTAIPANQDTLGTVQTSKSTGKTKCSGNVCKQIFKSIDEGYTLAQRYEGTTQDPSGRPDQSQKNSNFRGDNLTKKQKEQLLSKALELHKELNKEMTSEEETTLKARLESDLEKDEGEALVTREIETLESLKSADGTDDSSTVDPENDEGFLKRVKGALKSIGIEFDDAKKQASKDPDGDPEPTPTTGAQKGAQKMYTQEEVDAIAEKAATKAVETLKPDVDELKSDKSATKKAGLLEKAMEYHKKINKDMTPEEEKTLKSRLESDLEDENGIILVEREIQTMKDNAQHVTDQSLPFGGEGEFKEKSDKHAIRAKKNKEKIANMGKIEVEEE